MEYLDIIDDEDNVVGQASRDDIYSKRLKHRIVHVLIFNSKGEMGLQMRAARKDWCPLHWSTSVGGHVQAGENYMMAALREFKEELGENRKLVFHSFDWYEAEGLKKVLVAFTCVHEGPFNFNQVDTEKFEYFSLDQIKEMIKKGEKFHPELLFILERHF